MVLDPAHLRAGKLVENSRVFGDGLLLLRPCAGQGSERGLFTSLGKRESKRGREREREKKKTRTRQQQQHPWRFGICLPAVPIVIVVIVDHGHDEVFDSTHTIVQAALRCSVILGIQLVVHCIDAARRVCDLLSDVLAKSLQLLGLDWRHASQDISFVQAIAAIAGEQGRIGGACGNRERCKETGARSVMVPTLSISKRNETPTFTVDVLGITQWQVGAGLRCCYPGPDTGI